MSEFVIRTYSCSKLEIFEAEATRALYQSPNNKVVCALNYTDNVDDLMKKTIIKEIPINQAFNATDLLDSLIKNNFNVRSFPLRGYWLDIGKHDDFNKAQEDINYIKF